MGTFEKLIVGFVAVCCIVAALAFQDFAWGFAAGGWLYSLLVAGPVKE